MFTQDLHNNIGRHCTVGTGEGRVWEVRRAVTGSRYLVRNVKNGEWRVVTHRVMSNLY
jgi:hypothetical protein